MTCIWACQWCGTRNSATAWSFKCRNTYVTASLNMVFDTTLVCPAYNGHLKLLCCTIGFKKEDIFHFLNTTLIILPVSYKALQRLNSQASNGSAQLLLLYHNHINKLYMPKLIKLFSIDFFIVFYLWSHIVRAYFCSTRPAV